MGTGVSRGVAEELAKIPTYYIMDLTDDMPAVVAKAMPSALEIAACRWLPADELGARRPRRHLHWDATIMWRSSQGPL